jgi:hypothetical protein
MGTLYAVRVWNLTVTRTNKKESFLWWRDGFYRSRWKKWHTRWLELALRIPANQTDSPANVLARLQEAHCDPDIVIRLAFLEASQKPISKSALVGDNKRQQRIKRKLLQSQSHLSKAMLALKEVAQSHPAKDRGQQRVKRKQGEYRNHILKATLELERALLGASLIFIKRTDLDSLRTLADLVNFENVDFLRSLEQMCRHEIEVLLWPHTVELRPGHELFTLVSYVTACSGEPHFPLVTDLLAIAHQAYDSMRSATDVPTEPPTQDAIEKQVQRFRMLNSIQPELIEETTAQRAKSGELRQELLTCYHDQAPS